jgi:hypothetical protein
MALTDKGRLFVDAFCDAVDTGVAEKEAYALAREAAGYAETTSRRDILSEDVVSAIQAHYNSTMAMKLAKATAKMDSILDDPEQGGATVLLAAVNSVFDRGGLIKKESKEVTIKAPTGIVVMPSKAELDPE